LVVRWIQNGENGCDRSYYEILEWVKGTEVVYKNKNQLKKSQGSKRKAKESDKN